MEFDLSQIENALIIAPYDEHKYFLLWRERYPSLSFKLMTKEEVISSYYGSLKKDAWLEYMATHVDLSLSSTQLYLNEALKIIEDHQDEQVHALWNIKEELLKNGLIEKKDYFDYFLKKQKIVIFGYEFDQELENLLKKEGISYSYLQLNYECKKKTVNVYQTIEEEISGAFQKIIDLYMNGISLDKIHIIYKQECYDFPLVKLAKDFALPLESPYQESILDTEKAHVFLKQYQEDVEQAFAQDSEVSRFLNTYYNQYKERISDKGKWLEIFSYLLKKEKIINNHYEQEIDFSSRHLYHDDEYVFILGFEQGCFPYIYQDESYLPDIVKAAIGQATSKQMNKREKKLIDILIFANKNIFLSYKKEALDGVHHPSILIQTREMETIPSKLDNYCYSLAYAQKRWCLLRDYERKYGVKEIETTRYINTQKADYLSFDPTFKGSQYYDIDQFLVHSYSALTNYAQCPYKYYLSNVLRLDPFEGNYYTKLGVFVHALLEKNFRSDYCFESAFEECKKEQEWTKMEEVFVNNLKGRLQELWEYNLVHVSLMNNPHFILEQELSFVVSEPYQFKVKGFIDKIVVLGQNQDNVVLVDYKTGKDKFDPGYVEFGHNMQLPIYGLLIKNNEHFSNHQIVGMYIQHVMPLYARATTPISEIMKDPQKRISDYALQGLSLLDIERLETFCPYETWPYYLKGITFRNDGSLSGRSLKRYISDYSVWEGYLNETMEYIKKADERIRNNDFAIRPVRIQYVVEPCDNCPYHDICFVREQDVVTIIIEKEGDDDAEMD